MIATLAIAGPVGPIGLSCPGVLTAVDPYVTAEPTLKLPPKPAPKYCLGFAFGPTDNTVLLIEKNSGWQRGKLNGIGGTVESGETAWEAMLREAKEEAGLDVDHWSCFGHLYCRDRHRDTSVIVDLFRVFLSSEKMATKTECDEGKLGWYQVNHLIEFPILSNLRWMVPMALQRRTTAVITEHAE